MISEDTQCQSLAYGHFHHMYTHLHTIMHIHTFTFQFYLFELLGIELRALCIKASLLSLSYRPSTCLEESHLVQSHNTLAQKFISGGEKVSSLSISLITSHLLCLVMLRCSPVLNQTLSCQFCLLLCFQTAI